MLLASEQKKIKRIGLIHRIFLTELKNRRRHTASTKTKSEVRGGGRKPWRQKGTGNARAGSIRSPLWVGGGVSFGPRPHLVSKKINKKEKRLGILAALSLKSKILISELVGKKVKLKSRGKDFIGLCPFHNEKTPSFTLNDEKGFYHCFGCGAHGLPNSTPDTQP